ncbi:MAG: hypothetical protein QM669_12140 [Siphonobacter sp.]
MKPLYIGLVIGAFAIWGCTGEPDFSDVPSIEFSSITKYSNTDTFGNAQDSLVVSLKFQDGDGDLGLSPDTYPEDSTQYNEGYNYQVKTYQQKNGTFVDITASFGVSNSGNFPRLRTDGKTGPIEGILSRAILIPNAFIPENDTLKFSILIRDRALNSSNEVETTAVVLNAN